ncbi:MAG: V-type ATP synthase subunit I [Clostridiales bacterium]|nr:V-type ATP synthase subunit I [Clostridiales bacterium]
MAKIAMKRIEILALIEDSKMILDSLQRKGIVEISDYEEHEALYKLSTSQSLSIFEKSKATAVSAQTVLDMYVPQKTSLLSAMEGRKELTASEFISKSENADATLRKCYELNALYKSITENRIEIVRNEASMDSIRPWLDLDISMKVKGTVETQVFIGNLPSLFTKESLLLALSETLPEVEEIDAQVVCSSKDQSCAIVFCMKGDAPAVEQGLREMGFVRPAETGVTIPKEHFEELEKKNIQLKKKIEDAEESIKTFADIRDELEFVIDYFALRIEKYESLKKISLSKNTFILKGYISENHAVSIAKELEQKYAAAVTITQPEEDEEPPILLKNNAFAAPVESVTEMYSLPNNDDVDPNPIMAFFYYMFFGIMLSDGGYGLVMVIAMLIAKKKFNLEEKTKKTVNFFLYCGLSTVFWGAMFGGWFGDIIQIVGKQFFDKDIPSLALWFEPVRDPMKLLLYSFLFGIIHLFVGLGVRFSILWKLGKKLDAILDVVPVYLLVLGAAPLGAGVVIAVPVAIATIGKYLAMAGAVLIVLTSGRSTKNIVGKLGGGLYGLYNAGAGYMSDILSYSRLLALGLSTGVIASVVNVLGTIPSNLVTKAFMLIFVFVIGHTVNIAVNLIGSYVHTNRLQYVEFFSKFYEGGGRAFTPLKADTKYYRFKEEVKDV